MPISFTTLQIFDQYLTTYRNKNNDNDVKKTKSTSKYNTHNFDELKNVYTSIQWKNRFAPLYLTEPTLKSVAFAVHLKESANSLASTLSSLSGDEYNTPFSLKTVYSDNENLASVEYLSEKATSETPDGFKLEIKSFATPQINTGSFLKSDQTALVEPSSYSFDILTNKLHYELQFVVNSGETHNEIQNKLARLINSSDIGVSARVIEKDELSALEVYSNSTGLPLHDEYHFKITDDNTSYKKGIVNYLGLNRDVKTATNATYLVNGQLLSSYSNSFIIHDAYSITLHPDSNENTVNIGFHPDSESLSHNIEAFVDGYNTFIKNILPFSNDEESNNNSKNTSTKNNSAISELNIKESLSTDIYKFMKSHENNLKSYGIEITDSSLLELEKSDILPEPDVIQSFGNHMMNKLKNIAMDPMAYVDRRICAYKNPATSYINPYMTSVYTGMLFNLYI